MNRLSGYLCALAPTLVGSAIAHADPADETIYVVDDAPDASRDRGRVLGDAPFVTIVHPDQHAVTASVAEALATTSGVQLRSLGGLGAYQSLSVRGAASGHTNVLIDGVPLARIAAVTTDLGRFSLDSFGAVELYRGAVPVELGGAGVGGAVNMITRLGRGENGERVRASAGVGSYGSRHLRAHYGDDHGPVSSSTTVGYQGADGDFTYFDDNGTLLNRTDDLYRERINNEFDQLDAATRVGANERALAGGVRTAWKREGLPGSISNPTMSARLTTLDVLADAQGDVAVGPAVARQIGYVLYEHQTLRDPENELGLGATDRAYDTLSYGATTTWRVPLAAHHLAAGLEVRGERFSDEDESGERDGLEGSRIAGAATAAFDLSLAEQLVVTPSVRVDLMRSRPTPLTAGPTADMPVPTRDDVVASPRLSVRAALTQDVAIKGSTGLYTRLPTIIEVFGNRGVIVGSPDLEPEHGPSSDIGIVWAPARSIGIVDRILVQADAFANRSHDTIAFITTAGYAARAINLDDTQAYGAELVASARFGQIVSGTLSYTRLVTAQLTDDPAFSDNPIPRRPSHLGYARVDLSHHLGARAASAWTDASYQSESTLDRAALQQVPSRVLLGAGARLELLLGFSVSASIANLTDRRISHYPLDPPPSPTFTEGSTPLTDLTGFPLPGRSFYLTLDWTY